MFRHFFVLNYFLFLVYLYQIKLLIQKV